MLSIWKYLHVPLFWVVLQRDLECATGSYFPPVLRIVYSIVVNLFFLPMSSLLYVGYPFVDNILIFSKAYKILYLFLVCCSFTRMCSGRNYFHLSGSALYVHFSSFFKGGNILSHSKQTLPLCHLLCSQL